MGGPNKSLSDAVEARQEMDLKVGVAWTRYQTNTFSGKYRDLDAGLLSYGPCQTPTLYFCVKRFDEIQSFKPENYYILILKLKIKSLMESLKSYLKSKDPECRSELSQRFRTVFFEWNQQTNMNGIMNS